MAKIEDYLNELKPRIPAWEFSKGDQDAILDASTQLMMLHIYIGKFEGAVALLLYVRKLICTVG